MYFRAGPARLEFPCAKLDLSVKGKFFVLLENQLNSGRQLYVYCSVPSKAFVANMLGGHLRDGK